MKNLGTYILAGCLLMGAAACGNGNGDDSGNQDNPSVDVPVHTVDFAKGADISWATELESQGHSFYNAGGEKRECTALMKELGLNAIRLRVFVEPRNGYSAAGFCGKDDVVAKAKRVQELGMPVMIDFHYSDNWADPGKQFKPKAWQHLDLAELKKGIAAHTRTVLGALKEAGVTPQWVQVGNEIRPGMLWDTRAALSGASYEVTQDGQTYPMNWANLGAFIATGYDTVKEVFPQAEVIVHLDNGYDQELYTWFFDELKKNGGKWDMIGMSIYPYWTMESHPEYTADKTIDDCIANVNAVSARYDCDVMIVETGMECGDRKGGMASDATLAEGKRLLAKLIGAARTQTSGRCKGVFYWEPECKPATYHLGAFTAEGRPTVIMEAFR